MGDSLTAGHRLKSSKTLPVLLEQKLQAHGLDVEVINGGVSGDTTAGGLKRLEWMLEKHQPDLVFVALGGNDMLRALAPAQVEYNLDMMLYTLHQKSIKSILMQVTVPANQDATYAAQFNAIYPKLAQKYNIALYPFFLVPIFGHAEYMLDDGIHPNAMGVEVIATQLADYFLKNGYF